MDDKLGISNEFRSREFFAGQKNSNVLQAKKMTYSFISLNNRLELQKRLPWLELQESAPANDAVSTTTEAVNAPAAS